MNRIEIEAIVLLIVSGITLSILKFTEPAKDYENIIAKYEICANLIEACVAIVIICFTIHARFLGQRIWTLIFTNK